MLAIPDHPEVRAKMAQLLTSTMCDNATVSSFAACVSGGSVCSDRGVCDISGVCQCDAGFTGTYCESLKSDSGSDTTVLLAALLGSLIPAAILLCLIVVVVGLVVWVRSRREKEDEWEVDVDELEMGEELGTGGYRFCSHILDIPHTIFAHIPPTFLDMARCTRPCGKEPRWR